MSAWWRGFKNCDLVAEWKEWWFMEDQSFISEIKDIIRDYKLDLRHIPKGQNDLADSLAKWSVFQQSTFMVDHMPE